MVASTMSGSSDKASKIRLKTSASRRSRNRRNAVHQLPNNAGKSRQGLPVRAIHNTASKSRRLFLPLRPGSVGLPRQCGSIFAHWASVSTKRSIQSVNHIFGKMKILNPYTSSRAIAWIPTAWRGQSSTILSVFPLISHKYGKFAGEPLSRETGSRTTFF